MNQWYYSTNGKAQGPVASDFIIESLRNGQLTLVDLVFRTGDAGWVTVGEIPEFRDAFKALPLVTLPPTPPPSLPEASKPAFEIGAFKKLISLSDSRSVQALEKPEAGWPRDWQLSTSWIVLKKRADGSGFDQDGPFSAEQIIEMIGEGKVDYSQYCWKPGYTRWFRIGNLPDFDRRKRDRDNDTVNQIVPVPAINDTLPALSREELLAGVERLRQNRKGHDSSAPVETNGQDLARTTIDITPATLPIAFAEAPTVSPMPMPMPEPEPQQTPQAQPSDVGSAPTSKPKVAKRIMRLGFAGAVAGLTVVGLLQYASEKKTDDLSVSDVTRASKTRKPAAKQMPQPEPKVQKTGAETQPPPLPTSQPESANLKPSPTETSAIAVAGPNPGSTIETLPLKLATAPVLTFQTDAGVGQTIQVKLEAKTGEVLRYGSFSRSFEVVRGAGELPTLDLANLDLPAGTYSVTASVGTAKSVQSLFIGAKTPEFVTALERHIKALSYRQQTERKLLLYGSQRLADLAEELTVKSQNLKGQPAAWKKALTAWRSEAKEASAPLLQYAKSPANESAYPDQLAAFKDAAERLAAQANNLDAAMDQKRDIASNEFDGVVATLKALRDEASKLSGRPQASAGQ